jgi:hypothetical protein
MSEHTLELDDLKQAWQVLDRRLARQEAMQLLAFRESRLQKARSGFRRLAFGQGIQIVAGVALMLVFAPFWVAHRDSLHLLVYGLSLHAYGLMLVLFAARDLYLIDRIDYAAPVLDIQKRLAELRAWHLRYGWGFVIAGCFVWTPLMLVIFYWLGADIWVHKPQVVYWFVASSFVALGASYGLVRLAKHFPGMAKAIDESAAGRSVTQAQAVLDEIARFERD